VPEFAERYNHEWQLEKIGFQAPIEVLAAHGLRLVR
jgi:hypothetical protein